MSDSIPSLALPAVLRFAVEALGEGVFSGEDLDSARLRLADLASILEAVSLPELLNDAISFHASELDRAASAGNEVAEEAARERLARYYGFAATLSPGKP